MKEINLIASQEKKLLGFYEQTNTLKKSIFGLNLILVVLMGVFFSFYLSTSYKMKSNEAKINALKKEITALNKKETYLIMVDNRLKEIDRVFKSKISQEQLLQKIRALFVPGFVFSSLNVSGLKQSKIVGQCSDSLCLSQLYDKAEELKQSDSFSEFTFNNVNLKINQPFEITISLKD
jgi:hypothetical protein